VRARFLSAALLAVVAGTAHAYRVDEDGNGHPLHWEQMPIRYQLVSNNSPAGLGGEEAVQRAFRRWSDASANVEYVFDGFAGDAVAAYDRRNLVFWKYADWPYDSNALAVTARYYSKGDGGLIDADIIFNGAEYSWSTGASGYDIENAAAHEVGHFGGLGHSTDPTATMHSSALPGETKKRTLASDDQAGLDAIYGGVAADDEDGDSPIPAGGVSGHASGVDTGSGGGCAIAADRRAGASDLLPLAALLVILAWTRLSWPLIARATRNRKQGGA